MKKKLVFLALALVMILVCAVAMADTKTIDFTQKGEDFKASWLIGQKIPIDGVEREIKSVGIYKDPANCDDYPLWKLYYEDDFGKKVYVIGKFFLGDERNHGHTWASTVGGQFDETGLTLKVIDIETGIYQVTYKNKMTTTLKGADWVRRPTCTEAGEAKDFCVFCGKTRDGVTIKVPALAHDYESKIVTFPNCKKTDVGEIADVCKVCGHVRRDGNGKVIVKETFTVSTVPAAYQKQYTDAGYELGTGHKWDGWHPGETACIQSTHCLICEKTKDKLAAPTIVVSDTKIIDCYAIEEVRVCATCQGKTTDSKVLGILGKKEWELEEKERHESRVVDVGAGQMWIDNGSGVSGDEVDDHAWHVYDKTKPVAFYTKDVKYADLYGTYDNINPWSNAWDGDWTKTSKFMGFDKNEARANGLDFCVTGYVVAFNCQNCGRPVLVEYGPDGHKFSDWTMHYAPGSGEGVEGEWIRDCSACGKHEVNHGVVAPTADHVASVEDYKNGLQFVNGQWGWYVDGNLQGDLNTLVPYMTGWFLLKNGVVDTTFTGEYVYDGGTFYLTAGQVRHDLDGLVNTEKGFKYFAGGQLQKVTTLVQYDGQWFYIIDGELATGFNGVVEFTEGHHFTVQNGQVVGQVD